VAVGDSIIVLPNSLALDAKNDAWIVSIMTVFAGTLFVLLFHAVGNLYPKLTFVEYSEKIMGKLLGKIISIIF